MSDECGLKLLKKKKWLKTEKKKWENWLSKDENLIIANEKRDSWRRKELGKYLKKVTKENEELNGKEYLRYSVRIGGVSLTHSKYLNTRESLYYVKNRNVRLEIRKMMRIPLS